MEKSKVQALAVNATKARLLALDLDPVRLAEANAHRIPVYTDEAKKKINPIKASKRGLRG